MFAFVYNLTLIQLAAPHFIESPYFIVGAVICIILLALFLRKVLFGSGADEYRHNPED